MTAPLTQALGFGACWLSIWLLLAALPAFGRTPQERSLGLPIGQERKKMRRRLILVGVVSALVGVFIAYAFGSAGDRQVAVLLLAFSAASACSAFLLIGLTFGFRPRRVPARPPKTGYRAKPPADRDGPHT